MSEVIERTSALEREMKLIYYLYILFMEFYFVFVYRKFWVLSHRMNKTHLKDHKSSLLRLSYCNYFTTPSAYTYWEYGANNGAHYDLTPAYVLPRSFGL